MKKKLMAFWPYSSSMSCTHFLCGTVTDMRADGHVETEEYGKGYYLEPEILLPLEAGQVLKRTLQELDDRHTTELRSLRKNQFKEVANAVRGYGLRFNKE